jgi:hypothetical protein
MTLSQAQPGFAISRSLDTSQAFSAQLRFGAAFIGAATQHDIVHVDGSMDGESWAQLLEIRGSWAIGAMTVLDLNSVRGPMTSFRFRVVGGVQDVQFELEYVTVLLQVSTRGESCWHVDP